MQRPDSLFSCLVSFTESLVSYVSFTSFTEKIIKLARLGKLEKVNEDMTGVKTFISKGYKFFIVTGEVANAQYEKQKLLKELEYTKGFLASVEKKLSNDKFVSSAPAAVIESEKKKKADALSKIAMLEQSLAS